MQICIECPFMRENPSHDTKVASQALFAEEIVVLEARGDWAFIQTPDGYRGWALRSSFIFSDKPYIGDLEVQRLAAHIYSSPDTEFGPMITVPFGTKLKSLSHDARWIKIVLPDGREAFIQKGDVEKEHFELKSFSKKFLGIPYTWGGRSSFGFDCSGFVQMLYSRLNIALPRDARQQLALGKAVFFDQLILGDLIFWGHSLEDIRHVGMFLEKGQFIHTSTKENKPYLRISSLSDLEWAGTGSYSYRTARRINEFKISGQARSSQTAAAD